MKKESDRMHDNSFGVAGVVFGIMSLLSLSAPGIVIGIIGLVFSMKQKKIHNNKWAKWGVSLNIIGIVLGILAIVALATFASDYLANVQGTY